MEREYTWILAHPTLEDLHFSSINLPHDVSGAVHPSSNSPLKRLTLDEANVTLDGLRSVLSFPRALECLYIGRNIGGRCWGSVIDASQAKIATHTSSKLFLAANATTVSLSVTWRRS